MSYFEVDFNEIFYDKNGNAEVRLSLTDKKTDKDGNQILLYEGMLISVFEPDIDADGQRDNLIASGVVTKFTAEHIPHGQWCCKIDENGIRHESDL